jgi:hypothetical protein
MLFRWVRDSVPSPGPAWTCGLSISIQHEGRLTGFGVSERIFAWDSHDDRHAPNVGYPWFWHYLLTGRGSARSSVSTVTDLIPLKPTER